MDHNLTPYAHLLSPIEEAWNGKTVHNLPSILEDILHSLSQGDLCVVNSSWEVQEWIKKAILLVFRHYPCSSFSGGWDKVPLLPLDLIKEKNSRLIPGAFVRHGACIGRNCIIMPSFINMGASIGDGTMIDSGTSIGSCAFIGKNCHISSTVTIGGVLEPLQAQPVIIEDNCFVGAGCHVLEGVRVGKGSVLGAGLILTSSTKIITRETGDVSSHALIPPGSVVVPGAYPSGHVSLQCAVIIKTVDEKTREKTSLNDLLRVI